MTNKVDHLNVSVLAYAYNANGWLTNRWSKQKGNTEYRYDPVGNLTNVNYPATADLVFEYDALNRVTTDTRKGVITNTYTYHPGGQLATEATPQWASSTVTLGYTSRLRTSLTLAQPVIGNWTHAYTWDSARRLDTLTGSSGSFDYDYIAAATSGDYASRLVKKLTVPTTSAGPNLTNLWDTTGRLTETKLVNGGTTFNRHAYVLNAAHQRTLCAPGGSIFLPVATTPVFGGRCRHFLGIVHLPTKRAPRTTVDRGAVLGWRAHEDRSRVVRGRRAGGQPVPGSLPDAGHPARNPRG